MRDRDTETQKETLTSMNDNERWRILTMGKGACKNQNAMPQREAVRFAEKRDEKWLNMQAAMATFTKIHRMFFFFFLFWLGLPFSFFPPKMLIATERLY